MDIIIDDVRGVRCASEVQEFPSAVDNIAQHKISRLLAKKWARSLRFLTFDDEAVIHTQQTPTEPDVSSVSLKQQCAACELNFPRQPTGHECYSHRHGVHSALSEPPPDLHACSHVAKLTCTYCHQIPLFPTGKKVTRFRIRRIAPKTEVPLAHEMASYNPRTDVDSFCGHFVAVSYCWASQHEKGQADTDPALVQTYQVVEEDGSIRNMRAPRHVIDRVVAFASWNGYRMIWIDQECIEQDNELEKAIGVQAMDLVYLNAHITVGLYTASLDASELTNLLGFESQVGNSLQLKSRNQALLQQRHIDIDQLKDAVNKVLDDPWNWRAWIIQEAVASRDKIVVLLPLPQNLDPESLRLICHQMSASEVCIDLGILNSCLQYALGALAQDPHVVVSQKMMTKFEHFRPKFSSDVQGPELTLQGSVPRHTYNAAGALSALSQRDNSVVGDRIAIVANLCGYELRINSYAVAKVQKSLALCIVTMALMNGDFSLLTPEMYSMISLSQNQSLSFHLHLSRNVPNLKFLRPNSLLPRSPSIGSAAPESYHFDGTGIRLPGLLWKADGLVHLEDIQRRYKRPWQRLNKERAHLLYPFENDAAALAFVVSLDSRMLDFAKRRERAITQILFDTLISLRKQGQIVIADAIWQSVSNPYWQSVFDSKKSTSSKKNASSMESVANFPSDIKLESRKPMFRLGQHVGLEFPQEWLINRIMEHGTLYKATLVRKSTDTTYVTPSNTGSGNVGTQNGTFLKDLFDDFHEKAHEESEANRSATSSTTDDHDDANKAAEQIQRVTQDNLGPLNKDDIAKLAKSKFMTQLTIFFMLQVVEKFVDTLTIYPQTAEPTSYSVSQAMTVQKVFSQTMFERLGMGEAGQPSSWLVGQQAVFDLNPEQVAGSEACLVLTPFSYPQEAILFPPIRRMSISHVVEKVAVENEEEKYERFRSRGLVRGMWQIMIFPGGRYKLV